MKYYFLKNTFGEICNYDYFGSICVYESVDLDEENISSRIIDFKPVFVFILYRDLKAKNKDFKIEKVNSKRLLMAYQNKENVVFKSTINYSINSNLYFDYETLFNADNINNVFKSKKDAIAHAIRVLENQTVKWGINISQRIEHMKKEKKTLTSYLKALAKLTQELENNK